LSLEARLHDLERRRTRVPRAMRVGRGSENRRHRWGPMMLQAPALRRAVARGESSGRGSVAGPGHLVGVRRRVPGRSRRVPALRRSQSADLLSRAKIGRYDAEQEMDRAYMRITSCPPTGFSREKTLKISDVHVSGGPRVLAKPADVDALESALWITFPDGYREYVTKLG